MSHGSSENGLQPAASSGMRIPGVISGRIIDRKGASGVTQRRLKWRSDGRGRQTSFLTMDKCRPLSFSVTYDMLGQYLYHG